MHKVTPCILFYPNLAPFLLCLHFILSRWPCEVVFSHPDFRAHVCLSIIKSLAVEPGSHTKSWTAVIILKKCVFGLIDLCVKGSTGGMSVWWSWLVEAYQQELLRFSHLAFITLKHCYDLFPFMYIILKY